MLCLVPKFYPRIVTHKMSNNTYRNLMFDLIGQVKCKISTAL